MAVLTAAETALPYFSASWDKNYQQSGKCRRWSRLPCCNMLWLCCHPEVRCTTTPERAAWTYAYTSVERTHAARFRWRVAPDVWGCQLKSCTLTLHFISTPPLCQTLTIPLRSTDQLQPDSELRRTDTNTLILYLNPQTTRTDTRSPAFETTESIRGVSSKYM